MKNDTQAKGGDVVTAHEMLVRVRRRLDDFKQATMQLEPMIYSKIDAELDEKIARHIAHLLGDTQITRDDLDEEYKTGFDDGAGEARITAHQKINKLLSRVRQKDEALRELKRQALLAPVKMTGGVFSSKNEDWLLGFQDGVQAKNDAIRNLAIEAALSPAPQPDAAPADVGLREKIARIINPRAFDYEWLVACRGNDADDLRTIKEHGREDALTKADDILALLPTDAAVKALAGLAKKLQGLGEDCAKTAEIYAGKVKADGDAAIFREKYRSRSDAFIEAAGYVDQIKATLAQHGVK